MADVQGWCRQVMSTEAASPVSANKMKVSRIIKQKQGLGLRRGKFSQEDKQVCFCEST